LVPEPTWIITVLGTTAFATATLLGCPGAAVKGLLGALGGLSAGSLGATVGSAGALLVLGALVRSASREPA
jgi:hypothetical protein